ncbi:MAG TPA: DUF748 domain-containing protein [Nitrospiraceae bacterium]|nr:DUF748 domain-containing protein [Nitrospiraceae bacterium]
MPRWLLWTVGIVAVFAAAVLIAAAVADGPFRRYIEQRVNDQLTVKGYTLRIGKLDLHPLSFSLDLKQVSLVQNRHPEPPMVQIPAWHAGVRWTELFKGRLVSDHVIQRPAINMTRPQARTEIQESRDDRWQDAVRKLFPLRIDALKVEDADVTYYDHPKARPLELTEVQFEAGNISNRGPEQEYPSTVKFDARLLRGRIKAEGRANFLAKPFAGAEVDFDLENVPIEGFMGVTGRYSLLLKAGVLTANGRAEYSPWKQAVDVRNLLLEGIKADYVYRRHPRDDAGRKQVAETVGEVRNNPILVVTVKRGKVLGSEFGFVNRSADPDYRLFVGDVNADLDNFSTRLKDLKDGDAVVKLTGRLMGTGRTVAAGTFRPEKPNPDFDLDVQIVKTEMKALNNVFRAYTDMDLSKGHLSLFSEISIKNGRVNGYVKPIFKDVEAYDPAQDADKAWTKQVYEKVIEGVVELLKNEERQQVAAETDVSGPVPSPRADTWQIVGTLIQNAFFKAILPGLEKEYGRA